jgi:hypothetical protein
MARRKSARETKQRRATIRSSPATSTPHRRASPRIGATAYTTKALSETTWPAFAALVEHNNGVFGGCWCMGFHEDGADPAVSKRERKLARVRAGTAHAALVFDGDDCVGWCQFGAPNEVNRPGVVGDSWPWKIKDGVDACRAQCWEADDASVFA